MTIGIDLDDTLIDTSKTANKYLKEFISDENIVDYHKLSKKNYNKFLKKYLYNIQKESSIKTNAAEVINYLKSKNIKIVIITARGSRKFLKSKEITEDFLKTNNIIYDKIVYNQNHKYKICQKEKVDLFIDDKEWVLDEIKNCGIKTLKFLVNDEESKHDIVKNWQEVKDYIINMVGEVKNE